MSNYYLHMIGGNLVDTWKNLEDYEEMVKLTELQYNVIRLILNQGYLPEEIIEAVNKTNKLLDEVCFEEPE